MNLPESGINDLKKNRVFLTGAFLIIFFSVGVFGIAGDKTREMFIMLTPLALIFSLAAIIAFHHPGNLKKEIIIFTAIFSVSFLIEALGVNTGRVFGNYTYGEGLWIKLLKTPLLIGINWVLLIYCTAIISDGLSVPVFVKILISSALMVVYDIIMEQVAPEMKMWSFENGFVPVRNYIAWFILAALFQSLLKLAGIKIANRIAPFVFYVQVSFFLILAVYFKIVQ
jgi:putative membrane protein